MGKQFIAALLLVCTACSTDDSGVSGWQTGGGAERRHAFGERLSTTLNVAKRIDLIDDTTNMLSTPAMLSSNVVVAALADGRLVRIENGRVAWAYRQTDATPFAARPAVDADGSVYAVDARGHMVALQADGSRRWTYAVTQDTGRVTMSDVLRTGDLVVTAHPSGDIVAVDRLRGTPVWRIATSPLRVPALAATTQSTVFAVIAGTPDTLLGIDRQGRIVQKTPLEGLQVTAGPAVGRQNHVVLAGRTTSSSDGAFGAVCAVGDKGNVHWNTRIGTIPQFISLSGDTTMVVCAEPGAVGLRASRIVAIDGSGVRRWGVWYDKLITSPLIIGSDAMMCTITEDASAGWHDVLVLWRDGRIRRHIACNAVPRIMPDPVVTSNRTLMMGAAKGCTIVTLDETLMYNILPQ